MNKEKLKNLRSKYPRAYLVEDGHGAVALHLVEEMLDALLDEGPSNPIVKGLHETWSSVQKNFERMDQIDAIREGRAILLGNETKDEFVSDFVFRIVEFKRMLSKWAFESPLTLEIDQQAFWRLCEARVASHVTLDPEQAAPRIEAIVLQGDIILRPRKS